MSELLRSGDSFIFPGMAYVALAGQTAGAVSVAEAMSNLLLQRILGSGPSVKYGVGSGLLAQAAAGVGGNCAASGVCQMYSDAGLIGALVVSEAATAGENHPKRRIRLIIIIVFIFEKC